MNGEARSLWDELSRYPLHIGQQRLLFREACNHGRAVTVSGWYMLDTQLDNDKFRQACASLVARHELLRARVCKKTGRSRIAVCPEGQLQYEYAEAWGELNEQIQEIEHRAFSSDDPFPVRFYYIWDCRTRTSVVGIRALHLFADGWSLSLMFKEILQSYAGEFLSLKESPTSYFQHVELEADYSKTEEAKEALNRHRLSLRAKPLVTTPSDRRVGVYESVSSRRLTVSGDAWQALRVSSKNQRCSVASIALAALSRSIESIWGPGPRLFVTPVANRCSIEFDNTVGPFAQILPIVVGQNSGDLLATALEVHDQMLLNTEFSYLPIDQIFTDGEFDRVSSGSIVASISYQAYQVQYQGLGTTRIEEIVQKKNFLDFPIGLYLSEEETSLSIVLHCSEEVITRSEADRLKVGIEHALGGGTDQDSIPLVGAVVNCGENTSAISKETGTLRSMFLQTVVDYPKNSAVLFEDESVSYDALRQRAWELGMRMRSSGVQTGERIALVLPPGSDFVVAVIACQLLGVCYVPIDVSSPKDRQEFIASDAKTAVCIVERGNPQRVRHARILELNTELTYPIDSVDEVDPAALSYIIYTSGTTGRPKGVMIPQGNVVQLFQACANLFEFSSRDVWSNFHSGAFDFSVWEIWGALVSGGAIAIVPPNLRGDPLKFAEFLVSQRVTVLSQTPSAFYNLLHALRGHPELATKLAKVLRYIVFGGEKLDYFRLNLWTELIGSGGPKLINMYGITETTVHVTFHEITGKEIHENNCSQSVIGRPLPHLTVKVLSEEGKEVRAGESGELYIAGGGVARGYWNQPALTQQRFVRLDGSDKTWYRSGDLVKKLHSGELEYIGRCDRQVQIRGYRVELSEIERVIEEIPGIQRAVTFVDEGVIYCAILFVPERSAMPEWVMVRDYCASKLPPYMLPSMWAQADSIPVTVNGKISVTDLKSLLFHPAVAPHVEQEERTAAQEELVRAVSNVLGVSDVSLEHSFISLGGDSIRSLSVVEACRAVGIEVSILHLIDGRRLREVQLKAGGLQAPSDRDNWELSAEDRAALPGAVVEAYPILSLQAGMVLETEKSAVAGTYIDCFRFMVEGPVDLERTRAVLMHLSLAHKCLRTSFDFETYSEPLQLVWRAATPRVSCFESSEGLREWGRERVRHGFDWTKAPLYECAMRAVSESQQEISIVFHHAILDGWSVASWISSLVEMLSRSQNDRIAAVLPLPQGNATREVAVKEFRAKSSKMTRTFWRERMRDYNVVEPPALVDSSRLVDSERVEERTGTIRVRLTETDSRRLLEICRTRNISIKSLALGVHVRSLLSWLGCESISTGLVQTTRPEVQGSVTTLGLFLNTLPMTFTLDPTMSWVSLSQMLQDDLASLYSHRHLPLSDILRDSGEATPPFFVFNCTGYHVYQRITEGSHRLLGVAAEERTEFGAIFTFKTDPGALGFHIVYDTRRISAVTARAWAGLFETVLRSALANPDGQITDLLETGSQSHFVGESRQNEGTWLSRFDLMCKEQPNSAAAADGTITLSYARLQALSHYYVGKLKERGVTPGSWVALFLRKDISFLAAFMACGRIGAVAVPVDPSSPRALQENILSDTRISCVVSNSVHDARGRSSQLVVDSKDCNQKIVTIPQVEATPSMGAYVMFTSGSTGKPKGVLVTHANLLNALVGVGTSIGVQPKNRWLSLTSIGFDILYLEILLPLISGGEVRLLESDQAYDTDSLSRVLAEGHVSYMQGTPTFWRYAIEQEIGLSSVHSLLSGGEILDEQLAAALLGFEKPVWNLYGPTETTIWVTAAKVVSGRCSSIGYPINNTEISIRDPLGAITPRGGIGELWIAGDNVANGYVGEAHPEAAERFSSNGALRCYRSGDRARCDESGVYVLGRLDQQVKIRGVRIELSAIEAAITASIKDLEILCVKLPEARNGSVIAIVYSGADDCVAQIQRVVSDHINGGVPTGNIVKVAEFPRTRNGKKDRSSSRILGLIDEHQAKLHCISSFKELCPSARLILNELGLKSYDPEATFFGLGGDSLKAIRIVGKLRKLLQCHIPLKLLMANPTIDAFVCEVNSIVKQCPSMTQVGEVPRMHTVTPASDFQKEIWRYEKLGGVDEGLYAIPFCLQLPGAIPGHIVYQALERLSHLYSEINSSFMEEPGELLCLVGDGIRIRLTVGDKIFDGAESAATWLARGLEESFTMMEAPLMRTFLAHVNDGTSMLLCVVHHAIADAAACQQLAGALITEIQARYATGEVLSFPIPNQPASSVEIKVSREASSYAGRSLWRGLDVSLLSSLRAITKGMGLSLAELLAGIFTLVITKDRSQDECLLRLPVSARGIVGGSESLGSFVSVAQLIPSTPRGELRRWLSEFALQMRDATSTALDSGTQASLAQGREVLFSFVSSEKMPVLSPDSRTNVSVIRVDTGYSRASIGLSASLNESDLDLRWEYRINDFSRDFIESCADAYEKVLLELSGLLDTHIESISIHPKGVGHIVGLMAAQSDSEAEAKRETGLTLYETWQRRLESDPGSVVVESHSDRLTAAVLEERVEMFSVRLRQISFAEDRRIVLSLEACPDFVALCLACSKLGITAVPVSSRLNGDQVAKLMARCNASAAVVNTNPVAGSERIYSLSQLLKLSPDVVTPGDRVRSEEAFLLFTSGSTGESDAVIIPHRAVTRLKDSGVQLGLVNGKRIAVVADAGFDASLFEIWGGLLAGMTLVFADREILLQPEQFESWLKDRNIHTILLTTGLFESLWRGSNMSFDSLRTLLVGGEELNVHTAREVLSSSRAPHQLLNAYGPTENGVITTVCELNSLEELGDRTPIGCFVSGTNGYIVDSDLQPLPDGFTGELVVVGAGVGLGYYAPSSRRQGAFITGIGGVPAYRTGDLVSRARSGQLTFRGRIDRQAKIRGKRVSLERVDVLAVQLPYVKNAHTFLYNHHEQSIVVSCIVLAERADPNAMGEVEVALELRRLSGFGEVPDRVFFVPSIPLTNSGKVATRELYTSVTQRMLKTSDRITPIREHDSADAEWIKVLGSLDPNRDFFAHGGTSLSLVRLLGSLESVHGTRIPLHTFLSDPTITTLRRFYSLKHQTPDVDVESKHRAMVAADLSGASVLPPVSYTETSGDTVLLTGGCGFVGSHCILDLLSYSKSVVCLVRESSDSGALRRLKLALLRAGWQITEVEKAFREGKIRAIRGDIEKELLGLSAREYDRLRASVGDVVHCAANVNHVLPYVQLRGANVSGTHNLLLFSSQGAKKRFHFISTLGAAPLDDSGITLLERAPDPDECSVHGSGYCVSKRVGEYLTMQAAKAGVDARIYRLGLMFGRSTDHSWTLQGNHTLSIIKACLDTGIAPIPNLHVEGFAVDTFASALTRLMMHNHYAQGAVFNMQPTNRVTLRNLFDSMQLDMKWCSLSEWSEQMAKILDERHPLFPFLSLYCRQGAERKAEVTVRYDTKHFNEVLRLLNIELSNVTVEQMIAYVARN